MVKYRVKPQKLWFETAKTPVFMRAFKHRGLNRSLSPKCRALPTALYPDSLFNCGRVGGQIYGQTHFWPLFFIQRYSVVWEIKAGKVQLWTGCFSLQMHAGNAISAFWLVNNDTVPEKQFFLKFSWNLFAQMQILEIVFIISQSFVFCKSEYKVLFSYFVELQLMVHCKMK